LSTSGCSGAITKNVAPNSVSGRVVKTGYSRRLGIGERDLGALGAADPVALHRLDVRGPADVLEIVQQAVGVVGDAEEPLLELARLDEVAAALAAAVDDLLVGQHGRVDGHQLTAASLR
jgi:hypothetical protein